MRLLGESLQEAVEEAMIVRLFPAARRYIGEGTYGSAWQAQGLRAQVAHPRTCLRPTSSR
ncbi:MAG: hypothetical protein ACOYEV_05180 [Candidatus Nanopelagicales bacterium]